MKDIIYVCESLYHLFVTLSKLNGKNVTIYLQIKSINNYSIIKTRADKYNKLFKIKYIDVNDFKKSFAIYSRKTKYKYKEVFKNKKIYIFYDGGIIADFLRKNKLFYYNIEDGYNVYTYNIYTSSNRIIRYLYTKLNFRGFGSKGYSKYCEFIEVNDKSLISNLDPRYKKMIEVPRKDLFNNISEERKKLILDIFDVKPMNYIKSGKSILVLTQPIYQDNFDKEIINSEEDQINYYKSIVDSYKEEYIVYFKVHPRDNTNYSSLNYDNLIFLDKDVPMELYEFVGDYNFDIGITHSSTALDYLSCVKEKIFLKDLRK